MSFTLQLDTTSMTPIAITSYTNYNYKRIPRYRQAQNRTRNGKLFTYKFGATYTRFEIPLTAVSSSDATIINSWWSSHADVLFIESGTNFSCKILNQDQPLKQFQEPFFDELLFNGQLILETFTINPNPIS